MRIRGALFATVILERYPSEFLHPLHFISSIPPLTEQELQASTHPKQPNSNPIYLVAEAGKCFGAPPIIRGHREKCEIPLLLLRYGSAYQVITMNRVTNRCKRFVQTWTHTTHTGFTGKSYGFQTIECTTETPESLNHVQADRSKLVHPNESFSRPFHLFSSKKHCTGIEPVHNPLQ